MTVTAKKISTNMTSTESVQEKIRLSIREQKVLDLTNQGWTQRQIGAELGLSPVQVSRTVRRAMRVISQPEADTLRKTHMTRLEFMWEQLIPAILNGDINAIRTGVLLLKRQAVMFGIDAPVQLSVKRVTDEYAEKFGLDEDERQMLFSALRDELAHARELQSDEAKIL